MSDQACDWKYGELADDASGDARPPQAGRDRWRQLVVDVDKSTAQGRRRALYEGASRVNPHLGGLARGGTRYARSSPSRVSPLRWGRSACAGSAQCADHWLETNEAGMGEATEVPRRSPGRGPPYWKCQEPLGHKSLQTTQLYTRIVIDDLRQVLARSHLRERADGSEGRDRIDRIEGSYASMWRAGRGHNSG